MFTTPYNDVRSTSVEYELKCISYSTVQYIESNIFIPPYQIIIRYQNKHKYETKLKAKFKQIE